jgi:hypothetical protein
MLISHQHKFIFLKTQKTAGTSLEIALSAFLSKQDVITPLSRKWPWPSEDESTRRELGLPGPSNCLAPLHAYRPEDAWNLISKGKLKKNFYNHMPAQEIKRKVTDQIWDEYIKISVERNPFDRAISTYYWRTRKLKTRPCVNEYIQICSPEYLTNWNIYTINNDVIADTMLRYERLHDDLAALTKTLNFKTPIRLPPKQTKGQFRQDKRPWQDVLDDKSIQRIRSICHREISKFNY